MQTIYTDALTSAPGSVSQVREAAGGFLRFAKESGTAVFLVGHVTKEGAIAGPRVVEHLVDTVLQFEGDRHRFFRTLRAAKNRFGSTDELGIFEMTAGGLRGIADPSGLFLGDAAPAAGAAVHVAVEGTRCFLVEVQALVNRSELAVPRRVATGFDRNRLAMIIAVLSRHAGLTLSDCDIFANIAGGIRIDEPAADLAVALAIASAERNAPLASAGRRVRGDQPDGRAPFLQPVGPSHRRSGPRRVRARARAGSRCAERPARRRGDRRGRPAARSRPLLRARFVNAKRDRRERRLGGLSRLYQVGDKVVYPHHGAGKIMKIEQKEVLGQMREYLTIQILHNDMTVMVPVENADRAGLRKVVEADVVEQVIEVLRGDPTRMPKNWSRRYKHNRDKLKTGDIFEVAEVVRNLAIRHAEKGLSTGEKQMFSKAKKILASELMYARDYDEDEANAFLESVLETVQIGAEPPAGEPQPAVV